MKAACYKWGEFNEMETITEEDFKRMEQLEDETLLGFLIREEDRDKVFYAEPMYIESGGDGTAVKWAYAVKIQY